MAVLGPADSQVVQAIVGMMAKPAANATGRTSLKMLAALYHLSTALVTTDTVYIGRAKRMERLSIISVAPLMGEAIRRIHPGDSVGALFT